MNTPPPGISPPPGVSPPRASAPISPTEKPVAASSKTELPGSSDFVPPSELPDPLSQGREKEHPSKQEGDDMGLEFDLEAAEEEVDEETKYQLRFSTAVDAFKDIVTSKNKILPYEFADELGLAEKIEEFYDFLNYPALKGIIELDKDEVKINKTKIMGGLMLGDDTILEKALDGFRSWLSDNLQ
jgi:hypothetical protein